MHLRKIALELFERMYSVFTIIVNSADIGKSKPLTPTKAIANDSSKYLGHDNCDTLVRFESDRAREQRHERRSRPRGAIGDRTDQCGMDRKRVGNRVDKSHLRELRVHRRTMKQKYYEDKENLRFFCFYKGITQKYYNALREN